MCIKLAKYFWLLAILLTSCTSSPPKLNRSYLPLRYVESSVPWKIEITDQAVLRVVPLNLDVSRNRQLVRYWHRGYFEQIFKKRHPVVKLKSSDISNLETYLNDILTIHYLYVAFSIRQTNDDLKRFIARNIHCEPLSNLEIRFLMNADSLTTFSEKPLSMLMISAHELMLQIGAAPEYPKVVSPYLRKKYGLSDLKSLEDANIFALKRPAQPPPLKQSGFAICRRER